MSFLTAIAGSATAQAQSQALIDKVKAVIAADTPRLEATFKDLHGNPELAFTETRTAGIVAAELKKLGYAVTTGIGRTGVVGVLKNGPGPTLWYRADMDANGGVRETTGLPWAATKPQTLADGSEVDVMHACGHDAHITWLLGVASAMTKLKSEWSGTLVVYAQPAEEVGLGAQGDGRRRIVDPGISQAGFRARQPHGAGRRRHGVQHGRRSYGRRRPARR